MGFFIFLFSSFDMLELGGSRKEKMTERSPKTTDGQEAFLEIAHIRALP